MKLAKDPLLTLAVLCFLGTVGTAAAAPFNLYRCGAIDSNPATAATCDDAVTGIPSDLNIAPVSDEKQVANAYPMNMQLSAILEASALSDKGIDPIERRVLGAHAPEPGSGVLLTIGLIGLTVLSGRKYEVNARVA